MTQGGGQEGSGSEQDAGGEKQEPAGAGQKATAAAGEARQTCKPAEAMDIVSMVPAALHLVLATCAPAADADHAGNRCIGLC